MLKTKTKISQKISYRLRLSLLALLVMSLLPAPSLARTFDPHNIITDQELADKDSLSKTAIQRFLERENSVLKNYTQTVNGQTMTAAEIVYTIAQKHNISPKFLLTTLEKEQSFISRTTATQRALDWACGFGCYGGTCREKYRGFYNQLEAAAETQEAYRQKASQFAFRVGLTSKTFDNFMVTPENQATANFYIYTPYVGFSPELGVTAQYGGNRLFWRIWQRYFTNQKFLDGQVVTDGNNYWLIKNNLKYKFVSQAVFLNDYQLSDAIAATAQTLSYYPEGAMIYYGSKTVVKSDISGQIYLIDEGQKRPVTEESALALLSDFRLALTAGEIKNATEDQLGVYTQGQPISLSTVYPQGKIYRTPDGKIWLIKDGLKHELDPLVLSNNYRGRTPEPIEAEALSSFPLSSPVKFKDGTFLNTEGNYYLISNGSRMRIQDLGVFDRVFGISKKEGAIRVSAALLNVHDADEIIDYADDTIKDEVPAVIPATDTTTAAVAPAGGTYQSSFIGTEPQGMNLNVGQSQSVVISFRNEGSAQWQKGGVWLQLNDQGKTTSSFSVPARIEMNEAAVSGTGITTFTANLTAPTDRNGLIAQNIAIYYNQNQPTKIAEVTKYIYVAGEIKKNAIAAAVKTNNGTIISENLPAKIKRGAKPIAVKVSIKNESDLTWLSKKTALEAYNQNGKASVFYDKNDWIRNNVPAVPVNKSQIKPGETGEFRFTLDVTGLKAGAYEIHFKLNLLDKNKLFTLNGTEDWIKKITIY